MLLDKHYDFNNINNEKKYDFWLKEKFFLKHDQNKKPFSIILPPPNITGKLHLGHALDTIISDVIIRYKKANGFDTIWVPGLDHAGISTQVKVIEYLKSKNIDYRNLGREKFLKEVFNWKEKYAKIIHNQWKILGLTLDYSYEQFTLDKKINKCVNKVFCDLYNKGLIYRGEKIINWDPLLKTALSNIEVIYKKVVSNLYYFKYFIDKTKDFLVIATTRPETMFGDVAIVVNSKDKRYKKYIGNYCINPVNNLKIKIIADDYVDMNFGTGVMKCTPAHDANDFEIALRHNLKKIIVMDENGFMNENALDYKKMDRYECRKKLVEDLKKKNFLVKIEKIKNQVGFSERSNVVIEPYLSKQWFIKIKPLVNKLIKFQKSKERIIFYPNRFSKILNQWMKNANDWCISRQLWWGHRIPVYYHKKTNKIFVSEKKPNDINNYFQDEDVLDTWFSSVLWPFLVFGWPKLNKRYFPTDLLVTGYDLIFFWVSRMIFQSLEFTNLPPFKKCIIHGLVRDCNKKKMSKTLGNGIDPFDIIKKYGVDALRYFLINSSSLGLDVSYSDEKLKTSVNYLNKIWNCARYILDFIGDDFKEKKIVFDKLSILEKYIISRLNQTIEIVKKNMDKYKMNIAFHHLYNFIYDDFCSFYLEISKIDNHLNTVKQTLFYVLKNIILLLYPCVPFITEEIYQHFPKHKKSIFLENYPKANLKNISKESIKKADLLKNIIKDIRNYKINNKFAPNYPIDILIIIDEKNIIFDKFDKYLKRFSFANKIEIILKKEKSNNIKGTLFVYPLLTLIINVNEYDKLKIKNIIFEKMKKIENEITRSEKLLSNKGFLCKAPKNEILKEKQKYKEFLTLKEELKEQLKLIK